MISPNATTRRWTKRSVSDVFVDTSAFFALANSADKHHREAVAIFEATVGRDDLRSSDHVILETWYLLRARLGRPAAMAFWDGLDRGVVTIFEASAEDFQRGQRIAHEWPDQTFSIVDCTTFAMMERMDIRRAFSFDRHFRIVRFGWRRQRALQILPY